MKPHFRLLGPLTATIEGAPVEVGGDKRRALLAALLLRAGEVVPRDELIDALWGEEPPDTARNTLQVYVSQLRKVLPDGLLETTPSGYRIAVDASTVDVFEFESLAQAGRSALTIGDATGAAETLRRALDLWRGPLTDLPQLEAVRLDELRLTAIEDRIDADLSLGRHVQL